MPVELVNLADPELALALSLIFCIIFLALGLKNPIFMMIGGVVWIGVAFSVFINYGDLFLIVGLGTGVLMMVQGGYRIAD
jgi:hypothetical protein